MSNVLLSEKIFRNLDEQLERLRIHGITIDDQEEEAVKSLLLFTNYYRLLNGSDDLFIVKEEASHKRCKPGTTLHCIYRVYDFDKRLQAIFFPHIVRIEEKMKSVLAYEFSKEFSHKDYLLESNFITTAWTRIFIDGLNQEMQEPESGKKDRRHPAVRYYMKEHGYVPLWVLVNGLTLGKTSTFYSLLKTNEKNTVSNHFSIPPSILGTFLKLLTGFRNICAHSDRLYNATLLDASISSLLIHDELKISKTKNQEYIYGKNDLFALLIVCYYFLKTEEFSQLCEAIDSEIIHLAANTRLAYEEIRKVMNFPVDWKKIKEINVLCKSRLPK